MDNRSLNQEENRTSADNLCFSRLYPATGIMLGTTGIVSLPTSLFVIVELLKRIFGRRRNQRNRSSMSPSEAFLLHVNGINVCSGVGSVLHLLATTGVCEVDAYLIVALFWPGSTAKPVFLLGISATVYLAVVRPATYTDAKAMRHFERVFTASTWLYSLLVNVICLTLQLDVQPVRLAAFCVILASVAFFNVSTLGALTGGCGRTVDRAKKRAFRVVLSALLVTLVYFVPNIYMYVYCFVYSMDLMTFMCNQFQVIVITQSADVVLSLIFLYSVGKLSVQSP